ncbi:MAG: A/G-specific adenine glycosylase [Phycisphaerales bacterium]|nr:A/G-specific adenine glycosylase [Phycisphaerales bacterium]
MTFERDRDITRALVAWFGASARELPWRSCGTRDPYRVLVSELMLQQTQASRVAERFDEFLARFPTVEALARADEGEVLAAWSGLGYYRRARLLHGAARAIVGEHGGRFPRGAAELASLPGLGRYTAGAVASLAFGEQTPAVDANVMRVVLRLEGRVLATADPRAVRLAWARAGALVEAGARLRPARGAAVVNEALIELGAVVCPARGPKCGDCPVAGWCVARARGSTGRIPARKKRPVRRAVYFASVLVADGEGRLAVTRRGDDGLWAGLHEAPTVERMDRASTGAEVGKLLGVGRVREVGSFAFKTTHRDCHFVVYRGRAPRRAPEGWRYLGPEAIAGLGLSSPQRRILLEMGAGGA